jgi:hydrogenase expression/formation protein HypC
MCIGLPMQVLSLDAAGTALCRPREASATPRRVDLSLLDKAPEPGQWLLVHVDVALRQVPEQEAQQVTDALLAVSAAARGEPFEHLLRDLLTREPQLPAHLEGSSSGNAHLQGGTRATRLQHQQIEPAADSQQGRQGETECKAP